MVFRDSYNKSMFILFAAFLVGVGVLLVSPVSGTFLKVVGLRSPYWLSTPMMLLLIGLTFVGGILGLRVLLRRHTMKWSPLDLWIWSIALFIIVPISVSAALLVADYAVQMGRCNMSIGPGASLSNCDYVGQDWTNRDLSGADLSGANLSRVNLTKVNLTKANLTAANLSEANLTSANLSSANLTRANLTQVNLTDATLNGATLDSVSLHQAAGVTNTMLSNIGSWRGMTLESRESMAQQLNIACKGQPIGDAASYNGDTASTFHPMVLFDSGGSLYPGMPEDWWPLRAQNTELVACFAPEREELIESCPYSGTSSTSKKFEIRRHRYYLDGRVIQAKSGAVVRQFTLAGSTPDECPDNVKVKSSQSNYEWYGNHVGATQIVDRLSQYANPKARKNQPPTLSME